MARTALTTQDPTQDGTTLTLAAAETDGNSLDGGRSVVLHVLNSSGDASTRTVTVQAAATMSGLAVEDLEVVVDDGDHVMIGPFDARTFDRASGEETDPGRVWVDYSDSAADLTVAAVGRG